MLARQEIARPRVAVHATKRRRIKAERRRYAETVRVLGVVALLVLPFMLYVVGTSNLTGLNYAIAHAQNERAQLQEDVQRLDDRIAHLESRERLAQIAAKLGMREPDRYELVTLPPPAPRPKVAGIAFLAEWFKRP